MGAQAVLRRAFGSAAYSMKARLASRLHAVKAL
jgi:hypothetical protein